jgi:iron complex transport system ATP-binding protein
MINVKNISYQISKKQLLQNISFSVKSGEIVAIIGANGAGKSTLLKILCQEINPTAGQIFINNKITNNYNLGELAKLRAVLAQHNTLSMQFTVKELVTMGRYSHFKHRPQPNDVTIINQTMQETGVFEFAYRDYNTLSGGEQQRVQLARVLAQIYDSPNAFLLLDEPTNGLDLLYQQQILNTARKMANKGFGVVCILHDINLASAYADKILILKNGQNIALGSPSEVINCYNIHKAFNINVQLMPCEGFNCPLVVPSFLSA